MSQFINYTLTIRNHGEVVPQIGDRESQHGQFAREFLEDIKQGLRFLDIYKSREDFVFFGKKLFKALLEPVKVSFAGQVWSRYIIESDTTNLRIRIVFEEVDELTQLASQIINLPWEFLCYPDDNNTFLGTHPRVALSYGYQTWLNNPLEGYAVRESTLRVLFVQGHPSKLPDVGFISFVHKILTELGEAVEVKELKNPTPDELSEALSQKPHILHFLGHGKPGALALGNLPDGETSWLEERSLSDFLRSGGVKLVVLQACEGASPSEELAFTGTAAQLVKTHVPAVIAIRYPIYQPLAWNFVRTLYGKLAAGEPVDVAVQAGREQLARGNQSHASRDFGAPVLWMRLRDGLLFAAGGRKPGGEEEQEAKPFTDETGELVCPYQGLNAFTEETKQFFFGRVRKVEEIEQRLNQRSFVPVIGASGSGKSSVVLAGLIPRLAEVGWQVLDPIKPGYKPLGTLEEMLRKQYFSDRPELLDRCINVRASEGLKPLLESFPPQQHLLVVDQFEELFTVAQPGQRDHFIELITQVATIPDSPLAVVTTMRADFIEPCLRYEALRQLIEEEAKYLPALTGKNLRDAICEPAKRQGYEVTDELLYQILEDIKQEPGFLPLLEFALTQLWQKRDEAEHQLTLEAYDAIGGMGGALNCHADKVYRYRDYEKDSPQDERTEAERALIKRIFLNLLQIGDGEKDTRLRQRKAFILSLAGDNQEEQKVLTELIESKQGLVKGRLLVTGGSEGEGNAWVDLAHEALIERWEKLNEWRTENREGRKLAKQLEKDAQTWQAHDKRSDYLWRGFKLDEAQKVLEECATTVPLSKLVKDFVEACTQQELRSYLRSPDVDSLDHKALEKEAAVKSFLTKERLWSLLEDERAEAKVRLAASWLLKQWGEKVPMRMAETDREGNISLSIIKPPPTVVEDLGNGISLEMVKIPGGEFWMGAPEGERGSHSNERPRHEVRISAFLMGKYPVTQAQWRTIASLPKVERDLNSDPSYFKGDEFPVECISWYDAVEFCKRLSRKTARDYRLPSEAEWEYACRAGTTTPFHFGERITPDLANYVEAARGKTTPIGRFQVANAFGLYDMHGQVWEWCADHWHDSYERAPEDGRAWLLINNENYYQMLRGGSWIDGPVSCRSAVRFNLSPDGSYNNIGLRVVAGART